ncbi:hypothetical protein Tco_1262827 [Tanacetum coccineum]
MTDPSLPGVFYRLKGKLLGGSSKVAIESYLMHSVGFSSEQTLCRGILLHQQNVFIFSYIAYLWNALTHDAKIGRSLLHDNIVPKLDLALELGKSISLTEAEEEAVAREVHATHARIVSESEPKPTQRRQSGIAFRDSFIVSKKRSSDSTKKFKGIQTLTPAKQEAADITMKALKESKKMSIETSLETGGSNGQELTRVYSFQVDEHWLTLSADLLRKALNVTPADSAHPFESPPTASQDETTGPSVHPEDATSTKMVRETLSHADAESGGNSEKINSETDTEILNVGSNSEQSHVALAGPNPEHMQDVFLATNYPKVHESLKHTTKEHVHLENPPSSSRTLSSMKNLEDS